VNAIFDGVTVSLTKNGTDYTGSISSNITGTKTLLITAIDGAGHTTTYNGTITTIPNHVITLSLSPSTADTGKTITASGTLTPDGNTTSTTLKVASTSGTDTVTLNGNSYSSTFTASNTPGTYTITATYNEGGYDYTVSSILTVIGENNNNQGINPSSGYSSSYSGGRGSVKPGEEQQESSGSNSVTPDEPVEQPPQEETTYEPLQPVEPRTAVTPQGTGIFNLGGAVKWIALLLAVGLLGGLGAYGYTKKPKNKSGMNWDGYFK